MRTDHTVIQESGTNPTGVELRSPSRHRCTARHRRALFFGAVDRDPRRHSNTVM
jgi:hypothetical protein